MLSTAMKGIKTMKVFTKDELKTFNCMGYAFGVELWINPRGTAHLGDWINEEYGDVVSDFSINCALDDIVDNMIEDYEGLELIQNVLDYPLFKEIMAFRVAVDLNNTQNNDYHFKVRRNGVWSEKNGGENIRECELLPDKPWNTVDFDNAVWSDTIYLAWKDNLTRNNIKKIVYNNIDSIHVYNLQKYQNRSFL